MASPAWIHPDERGCYPQWIVPAGWVAGALSRPGQTDWARGIDSRGALVDRDPRYPCPLQRPTPRRRRAELDSASWRRRPTVVRGHDILPRRIPAKWRGIRDPNLMIGL